MSYHSPLLFLSIYKQDLKNLSRFAVLCSKKVSARAVDRNRQRRRVYKSIQALLPRITPGYYGVVTLKKEAKESIFTELDAVIKNLFTQAHLID